jgi:hypothetical protein
MCQIDETIKKLKKESPDAAAVLSVGRDFMLRTVWNVTDTMEESHVS